MQTKERVLFWDILKGYGMISVVLGHCCFTAAPYIYTYHIILFFFVSAYFYNEKKYLNKPFEYIGNLLKNNWTKYVFYMSVLVLFHNVAIRFALYPQQPYYSFSDICNMLVNTVTFSCGELFGTAMWFVVPNIVSCAVLALSVTFSDRVGNLFATKKAKSIIKYVVLILLSIIYCIMFSQNQIIYNANLAFLASPVCVIAYFIKKTNISNLTKCLNIYVAGFFGFLLFVFVKYTGFSINLAANTHPGRIWFSIISLIAIYFCMYLSKVTEKIPYFSKVIAFLGRYSFAVMSLHFVAVKLCDRIYGFMIGEKDPAVLAQWVTTYPEKLLWVYLIAGTALPAVFGWMVNKLKNKIESKINKSDA